MSALSDKHTHQSANELCNKLHSRYAHDLMHFFLIYLLADPRDLQAESSTMTYQQNVTCMKTLARIQISPLIIGLQRH